MKSILETKLDQGVWCGSVQLGLTQASSAWALSVSKHLREELAANKEQATQFRRLGGPYEKPPDKLFSDSMCLERRDSSLGNSVLDWNYSGLFSAAGSINQTGPPPPSQACSQSTIF